MEELSLTLRLVKQAKMRPFNSNLTFYQLKTPTKRHSSSFQSYQQRK